MFNNLFVGGILTEQDFSSKSTATSLLSVLLSTTTRDVTTRPLRVTNRAWGAGSHLCYEMANVGQTCNFMLNDIYACLFS